MLESAVVYYVMSGVKFALLPPGQPVTDMIGIDLSLAHTQQMDLMHAEPGTQITEYQYIGREIARKKFIGKKVNYLIDRKGNPYSYGDFTLSTNPLATDFVSYIVIDNAGGDFNPTFPVTEYPDRMAACKRAEKKLSQKPLTVTSLYTASHYKIQPSTNPTLLECVPETASNLQFRMTFRRDDQIMLFQAQLSGVHILPGKEEQTKAYLAANVFLRDTIVKVESVVDHIATATITLPNKQDLAKELISAGLVGPDKVKAELGK